MYGFPYYTDNAGQISVAGAPGQFAIFEQIADIVLNLIIGQGVGRLHVIFG
jgi:hypothetical protein